MDHAVVDRLWVPLTIWLNNFQWLGELTKIWKNQLPAPFGSGCWTSWVNHPCFPIYLHKCHFILWLIGNYQLKASMICCSLVFGIFINHFTAEHLRYVRYSWGAGKIGSEDSSWFRRLECPVQICVQIGLKMEAGDCPQLNMNAICIIICYNIP